MPIFIFATIICFLLMMFILIFKLGLAGLATVCTGLGFFMFSIQPVIFELVTRNIREIDYNYTNSVFNLFTEFLSALV